MMLKGLIKDEDLSDNRYDCYHLTKPVQIFHCLLDEDVMEECEINIAKECDLTEALSGLSYYLEYFKECSKELTSYVQKKIDESLPEDWFETIEVYRFSITWNSKNDFGATITCGDDFFLDHVLEFDFEMYEICNERLNG